MKNFLLLTALFIAYCAECSNKITLVAENSLRFEQYKILRYLDTEQDASYEEKLKAIFLKKKASEIYMLDTPKDLLSMMEKISMIVPVTVFDDGNKFNPKVFETPFEANLILTAPLNYEELDYDTSDQNLTNKLAARLIPCFITINQMLIREGKEGFITMPSCDSGPLSLKYTKILNNVLLAYEDLVLDNKIKAIYVEAHKDISEYWPPVSKIKIIYRNFKNGQLNHPSEFGSEFEDCRLFSFAFCPPGELPRTFMLRCLSDLYAKVHATDFVKRVWGLEGSYDAKQQNYVVDDRSQNTSLLETLIKNASVKFCDVPKDIKLKEYNEPDENKTSTSSIYPHPSIIPSHHSSSVVYGPSSTVASSYHTSSGLGYNSTSYKKDSKNINYLWLTLAIIVGLLIVGVGFYFMLRQCSETPEPTFTDVQGYQRSYPGIGGALPQPAGYHSSPLPQRSVYYAMTPPAASYQLAQDEAPPAYSLVYNENGGKTQ